MAEEKKFIQNDYITCKTCVVAGNINDYNWDRPWTPKEIEKKQLKAANPNNPDMCWIKECPGVGNASDFNVINKK